MLPPGWNNETRAALASTHSHARREHLASWPVIANRRRSKKSRHPYPPEYRADEQQRKAEERRERRNRRHRLPCWQYVLAFIIVGGIIAAGIVLLANYSGAPTDEPPAPSAATPTAVPTQAASSTPTRTPEDLSATAEALATVRSRHLDVTPSSMEFDWNPLYVGGRLLDPAQIEELAVAYTNDVRQQAGLGLLITDPAIADIARAHSRNMMRTGIFEHDIGGKGPTDRALEAGYDCQGPDGSFGLSENIAERPRVLEWGGFVGERHNWKAEVYRKDEQELAQSIVDGWMDSYGHRLNILDPDARRIGVGIAVEKTREYGQVGERFFATQNFSACP